MVRNTGLKVTMADRAHHSRRTRSEEGIMVAVKVIFPSGRIGVAAASKKMRHRDAHRFVLKHENELRARFGMKLFVGSI